MLNTKDAIATIAVKNLDTAHEFYEKKLGFKQAEGDGKHYINYTSGNTRLLVYKSDFAGGYKATVATWLVGDDIEKLVAELKRNGVLFEHYEDMPNTKLEGDIHVMGDMKNAWCKDPDGNILCFVNS